MRLRNINIILFTSISFLLSTSNNASSDECEAQSNKQIEKYIETCQGSDNIQEIGFAPHQKKRSPNPGEYAYELLEEGYPYKTFPIGDKKYQNKIWFYTNIKKDENNNIPKHIWHLIISPASPASLAVKNPIEGFLVNIDKENGDLDTLGLLDNEKKEYLAKSSVLEANRVIYTNNKAEMYAYRPIDIIWENLVKSRNFKLIKCERERKEEMPAADSSVIYDYTFYYHKISAEASNVNLDFGYRIPSEKTITNPGKVYGFVLNEDGYCLDYKTILAEELK